MSLFQNRPQASDTIQYYTLGQNKTVLIVGLGNVGDEFVGTRHNIGFDAVDQFAQTNDFPQWIVKKDLKCFHTSKTLGDTRVILIKPTTFMNLSGEAVQAAAAFYKIAPDHIVVVYDELDINFGHIRTRIGGSAAGHNGVKSVSQHIGENYGRIRIGIGPKDPAQMDSKDFVLARFNKEQQAQLKSLFRETDALLSEYSFSNSLLVETRSFIV
jgi:PTH1 family peptidyl-tRNA hydrolase